MRESILIVEDEFIVANDLRLVLEAAGYKVHGVAASVGEARAVISSSKVDIVLLDIHLKGKLTGIDLAHELREKNIAFVYLSANSNQSILEAAKATEPYGFLVKPYREKDVLVTLDIAAYRHKHSLESKSRQEDALLKSWEDITGEPSGWYGKLEAMAICLQSSLPFDFLAVTMEIAGRNVAYCAGLLRVGFKEYQLIRTQGLQVVSGRKEDALNRIIAGSPLEKMGTLCNGNAFKKSCEISQLKQLLAGTFQFVSDLTFPVFTQSGTLFNFSFFSRKDDIYRTGHLALLMRLQQPLLAMAIDMPAAGHLPADAAPDATRRTVGKPAAHAGYEGIVGNSAALISVLDLAAQVAPLDTSVLLLGESGTGKERIADYLHHQSARRNKPLVKINCAALPHALIESELFGHEKGAFTGAMEKKTGKFELASGGTIFLDEIGELPTDQQVKLLRVLQEKEIDRIGGQKPVKVDVRIIAATNSNLEKEVAEGRFRLDLYYRLNVFPIQLPSLRERKEDIAQLANHFAELFCNRINKPFHGISISMLSALHAYHWPGNIRELENIMEQSVILSAGKYPLELGRPLPHIAQRATQYSDESAAIKTLSDMKMLQQNNEREYISGVLRKTKGRIRGTGGAAELLNEKPTTLESRIAKLGIRKEDFS